MDQGIEKDRGADAPAAAADGNRHDRRRRTLKQARVVLTDWTTIDCTVRDLSEGGARLVFGDAFALPEEFRLLWVATNTIMPVRLLWHRGLSAGVGFLGPEQPMPRKPVGTSGD